MTYGPNIPGPTIEPDPDTIVTRAAVPMLSFSAVLFVTLALSQALVLPALTNFTVADVSVSVDEAKAFQQNLRAEVTALEDERTALALPYLDDVHTALMAAKRTAVGIADVQRILTGTMSDTAKRAGATAVIQAISIENGVVTVRGSIDDPKPSSMSVLASAMETLRADSRVAELSSPALTRIELEDGGYRSPFTITFRILP